MIAKMAIKIDIKSKIRDKDEIKIRELKVLEQEHSALSQKKISADTGALFCRAMSIFIGIILLLFEMQEMLALKFQNITNMIEFFGK